MLEVLQDVLIAEIIGTTVQSKPGASEGQFLQMFLHMTGLTGVDVRRAA